MSDRWKGFVFLPVGIILLAISIYGCRLARHFLQVSVVVPGVVVAERYGVHHPDVRFTALDGTVRTYPQNGEVTQHVGDHVRVRYDPHDPLSQPSLDTFGSLWGTQVGLAVMGGVFTLTGGGLLLSRPVSGEPQAMRRADAP